MATRVTLATYSLRRNPQWDLSDGQVENLRGLLTGCASCRASNPTTVDAVGGLGYSGFIVHPEGDPRLVSSDRPFFVGDRSVDKLGAEPNLADDGRRVERFLLETAPTTSLEPSDRAEAERAIASVNLYRNVRCRDLPSVARPVHSHQPPWEPQIGRAHV